jgi:hypothetical protein
MNSERLEETVNQNFKNEVASGRNLYFKSYYSDKSISSIDFREFFDQHFPNSEISVVEESEGRVIIQASEKRVVIFALPYDNWLLVYSSGLPGEIRKDLGRLDDRIGWLTDAWVPSKEVQSLYESYSEQRDKVTIKRRWDPYFLYRNFSSIPPEMQEFYEENLTEFEEQETEFSLRTPRWMVDDVLDSQLKDDFIQKSEIAESRFDVHLSNPGEAGVTVTQSGQVTHRSGEPKATIKVVDDVLGKDRELHSEFEEVVAERDYSTTDGGMVMVESFEPSKILRLIFPESNYDEESSIKLSNLLTVGQSDANFHGYVIDREKLDFRCHTYNIFDRSEYEIQFTEHNSDPVLYIRPIEASVDGIIYLHQRLKSKFDTRIQREILDGPAFPEV